MKKIILIIVISTFTLKLCAQVGINTNTPASTLDITAKNSTGTSTNVEGLLMPRVDRQKAQSMAGVPISTMIYINSITTGTRTGTAVNVDETGYYYFNGSVWMKLKTAPTPPTVINDATRFLGGTVYVRKNQTGIISTKGNGFTIINYGNGLFQVNFTSPLIEIYGISVNIVDSYGSLGTGVPQGAFPNPTQTGTKLLTNDNSQVSFISNSSIAIKTGNSDGNLSNRSFTFLVTGK